MLFHKLLPLVRRGKLVPLLAHAYDAGGILQILQGELRGVLHPLWHGQALNIRQGGRQGQVGKTFHHVPGIMRRALIRPQTHAVPSQHGVRRLQMLPQILPILPGQVHVMNQGGLLHILHHVGRRGMASGVKQQGTPRIGRHRKPVGEAGRRRAVPDLLGSPPRNLSGTHCMIKTPLKSRRQIGNGTKLNLPHHFGIRPASGFLDGHALFPDNRVNPRLGSRSHIHQPRDGHPSGFGGRLPVLRRRFLGQHIQRLNKIHLPGFRNRGIPQHGILHHADAIQISPLQHYLNQGVRLLLVHLHAPVFLHLHAVHYSALPQAHLVPVRSFQLADTANVGLLQHLVQSAGHLVQPGLLPVRQLGAGLPRPFGGSFGILQYISLEILLGQRSLVLRRGKRRHLFGMLLRISGQLGPLRIRHERRHFLLHPRSVAGSHGRHKQRASAGLLHIPHRLKHGAHHLEILRLHLHSRHPGQLPGRPLEQLPGQGFRRHLFHVGKRRGGKHLAGSRPGKKRAPRHLRGQSRQGAGARPGHQLVDGPHAPEHGKHPKPLFLHRIPQPVDRHVHQGIPVAGGGIPGVPHITGQRQGPAAGSHVGKALPGDIPGSVNRLDVPGRIRACAPHPLSELVHHILHRIQRFASLLVAVEELPLSVKRILHPLQGSNIIGIPLFHSAHAGNAPHRLNRLHAQALRAARRVGKTSIQIAPESSGIRLALLNLPVNRGHQQHQRLLVQHLIPVDIHCQQIGHVQRVGAPDILKPTPLGKSIRPPRPHDGIGSLLRTLGILQQIGRTRVPAAFLSGYAIYYPAGNLLLFLLDSFHPFFVGGILYACSLGKILPHSAVSLPHILKLWGLLTLPGPIQIRVGGMVHTKQGNAHIKAQASLLVRCGWGLVAFRLHQPFCFFVSVIPQGQRGKQLQATFVGLELRKLPGTRHLSPVLQGSRGVILLQMVKGLGKKVGMFRLLRQREKVCFKHGNQLSFKLKIIFGNPLHPVGIQSLGIVGCSGGSVLLANGGNRRQSLVQIMLP